jgi:hypothetical protein
VRRGYGRKSRIQWVKLFKRIRTEGAVLAWKFCRAKYVGQRKGPRDVVGVKLLDTVGKSTRRLTGRFTRRFVFTRAVNVAEKVCFVPVLWRDIEGHC